MRKMIALLLSAAILVSLFSACGTTEPQGTTVESTTAQTTESEISTAATTDESTSEVTSASEETTETTTDASTDETTSETTAEPEETEPALPPTPESVWNGAEELYIAAVPALDLGQYGIDNIYVQYFRCYIDDPEIFEKVKSYLSEENLTATAQPGTFGRGSHNFCIGSSHERNFKVAYQYEIDTMYQNTYVFCDGEKSNIYIISDEGREYIGSIMAECAIGSVVIGTEYSDRSTWGVASDEGTSVTIGMNSLKGYDEIIDRFEITYSIREQVVLDGLKSCLAPENMTEGSVLPGGEANFSVELPDGRTYKGYCFIGENGRLTVEEYLFTENNGETEIFILNEDAASELSVLVESFSIMSGTSWCDS